MAKPACSVRIWRCCATTHRADLCGDDLDARSELAPAYLAAGGRASRSSLSPGGRNRQPDRVRASGNECPASVSISAYNSLVACPYQFYARHILRLNELDEVQEGIEKRDYGERVHEILQRFHERYPQVSEHDTAEMEAALATDQRGSVCRPAAQDFEARAWLARWFKSLPAYLEWQAENEAKGWRYAESESAFDWQLEGVRLRGRIDRLDVNGRRKARAGLQDAK